MNGVLVFEESEDNPIPTIDGNGNLTVIQLASNHATAGLGAYELWLSLGHTGTVDDFFAYYNGGDAGDLDG